MPKIEGWERWKEKESNLTPYMWVHQRETPGLDKVEVTKMATRDDDYAVRVRGNPEAVRKAKIFGKTSDKKEATAKGQTTSTIVGVIQFMEP